MTKKEKHNITMIGILIIGTAVVMYFFVDIIIGPLQVIEEVGLKNIFKDIWEGTSNDN